MPSFFPLHCSLTTPALSPPTSSLPNSAFTKLITHYPLFFFFLWLSVSLSCSFFLSSILSALSCLQTRATLERVSRKLFYNALDPLLQVARQKGG